MARSNSVKSSDGTAAGTPHLAARFEDAIHAFRESWGRRNGRVTTAIPFTGYGGPGWVRVLARVMLMKSDIPIAGTTSVRGWRSFVSVPVRDIEVTITAGATQHVVRADRGGVLDVRIEAKLQPGWREVQISVEGRDAVTVPVLVVGADVTFGVVSDIDDTVMVTALPRPMLAAWNTFVLNEHARRAVTGMAVLYERLTNAHEGAPIVYLSTGAWNVAPALTRFLSRNLFPSGPLLLTDWGPTHDQWFRSGRRHKAENLRRLAAEFPGVKWLLIGDDGQHDEELYGDFAAAHPDSVAAVAIRQLTAPEAVLAGGRATAEKNDRAHPWIYAPDGAGLAEQLRATKLL